MMVLRNLLANAIKFTPQKGRVTISSEIHPKHITIHVTDTGVGMTPEERTKLFQRNHLFSKPGTSAEKGSGMGLLLCHEFLLKSEGTIRVDSEPGKGSTFTFTLPRFIFQQESPELVPAIP
jgi:signal transduction histidine kinase